jgi:hypothetical protein
MQRSINNALKLRLRRCSRDNDEIWGCRGVRKHQYLICSFCLTCNASNQPLRKRIAVWALHLVPLHLPKQIDKVKRKIRGTWIKEAQPFQSNQSNSVKLSR